MSITEFLAKNPSLLEILAFVEKEAQRIAAERKKAAIPNTFGGINV